MTETSPVQNVNPSVIQNQTPNESDPNNEENSGFFQEDNGSFSSMRLMCFLSMLSATSFGLLTILLDGDNSDGIYITFGFLISAFAPKALQKFAEQKIPVRVQK